MAYNIPNLPFGDISNRTPGGMRPQGPVDRFDESIGERSRGGRIPPELLQMLMAQLMGGQGGGAQRRPPMGRGRPPMGGPQRGGQRPPMGGGRPPMRGGPRGGGRPPVIKIEDLVRALSGQGGGRRQPPQANMAVPQAPR